MKLRIGDAAKQAALPDDGHTVTIARVKERDGVITTVKVAVSWDQYSTGVYQKGDPGTITLCAEYRWGNWRDALRDALATTVTHT